jgi:hypothetical protein
VELSSDQIFANAKQLCDQKAVTNIFNIGERDFQKNMFVTQSV